LEQAGHRFRTRSDTEVIVHLYEEHGENFVEYLRGEFAIALLDERQGRLYLVRDRFGIKPLYYAEVPDGLVFASEIKALFQHPQVRRTLNRRRVFQTLHGLLVPGETYFEGSDLSRPSPSRDSIRHRARWHWIWFDSRQPAPSMSRRPSGVPAASARISASAASW
jgi:asparagine synthase (glutamine-hydrolysing)